MRRVVERLLNLLRVRRPERELASELAAHLALLQDGFEARGLSPDAARRAARLALGGVEQIKERHRDARSFRWIEDAWQDAAYGLRLLRRSPIFTVTAALSLAVGIGGNTAIFTVANALLNRPPAGIASPSELLVVGTARGDGGLNPLDYALYREIGRRTTSLSSLFAEQLFPHVMGMVPPGTDMAEPVLGRSVTTTFFGALGSVPWRGRLFADADQAAAVLDYDYWRRRFEGDEGVVGRVVRLNGRAVTVVGVAAPDFHGTGIERCDLWLASGPGNPLGGGVMAGGRLRPGVSFETAAAEVRALDRAIGRDRGRAGDPDVRLNALPFSSAGGNRNVVRAVAAALMALVSLVLAAACANVAGITLTRASSRGREIALRAALGAGRGRLIRQLLTETAVLYLGGGLLGIGLAQILTRAARLLLPPLAAPIVLPLAVDWRVLLFAWLLSVGAAVTFGLYPAFRGSAVRPRSAPADGARSSDGRARARGAFVVGQIACSVVLVVLGITFVRVLHRAGAADPGFDVRGVDVATVDLSVTGEAESGYAATWRTIIDRVRQFPGVAAASLARVPPGGWEGIGLGGVAPGDRPGQPEAFSPAWNIVDPVYFATLGVRLVEGRDFTPADTAGAAPVVILSETMARRIWPGQSSIGKTLRLPPVRSGRRVEPRLATVVGVVADVRSSSLVDGLAEPYVYLPLGQSAALHMIGQMSIVTRRRGAASPAGEIAALLQSVDRRLVLARTESLADAVALGLTPQRVFATISNMAGAVALLLASMGIYGVAAYTVALRRREFAIRLALGAPRARIVRMVCRQGAWLMTVGLGFGLTLALTAVQVLALFIYGVPPIHVPTLVVTVALFLGVGAAASLVPAGRAVRGAWARALQED